ncbi:MAG: zinc ribbon domain-containing protein [Thaumarchaeota archaeon]|nr:zinc ribbon domain-containing protein [Candidatus Calditenuaceae archaeon]MDW8041471.1 hypothetical protein [Nitrososphaerota archaeon]
MSLGAAHVCANCGAPIDLSPDAVIAVCAYCGHVTSQEGPGVAPILLRPEKESTIRAFIERYARRKAGHNAVIRDLKFLIVPMWVSELRARTRYNGYRVETRTRRVGSGRRSSVQTYKVYVPVRGTIDERVAVAAYGRKFETIFGLNAVKSSLLMRYDAGSEVDAAALRGWEVISSELSEREALEAARTTISDEHRKRVESMTTKLFDCYTETEPISLKLVLYPVVEVRYESGGKSYRMCVDGVEGDTRVLKAELPMTFSMRLSRAAAGITVVLASAVAAIYLQPLVGSDLDWELQLVVIAAPTVTAAIGGLFGATWATAIQRVERALKEVDFRVLGGGA